MKATRSEGYKRWRLKEVQATRDEDYREVVQLQGVATTRQGSCKG